MARLHLASGAEYGGSSGNLTVPGDVHQCQLVATGLMESFGPGQLIAISWWLYDVHISSSGLNALNGQR